MWDEKDVMFIGDFKVNMKVVQVKDISRIRKFVPREDYKRLKNRKNARDAR